jgi:hypothetical protein
MITITTASQSLQESAIVLSLSTLKTPEEQGLALFKRLQGHQGLSQGTSHLLSNLEGEFQNVSQKILILAKLYWEILLPLQQESADPIFEEGKNEVIIILKSLLPQGMQVEDYLARYKKMQLILKTAEALQRTFEKKTEDVIQKVNADRAVFFEKTKATQTKTIELYRIKSAFHATAVTILQDKSVPVKQIQQKTEEMGQEVKALNARVTAHDQKVAFELQKFMKKKGNI